MQNKLRSEIIQAASKMMRLQSEHGGVRVEDKREEIQRMVEAVDQNINKLIYRLYELNENEVAIIETAENKPLPNLAMETVKVRKEFPSTRRLKTKSAVTRKILPTYRHKIAKKANK